MTELFIPRQGRDLLPKPLLGLPPLRPGESVRCVPDHWPATRPGATAGPEPAARPADLVPAGPAELPGGTAEVPGGTAELPGGTAEVPGGPVELPGGAVSLPLRRGGPRHVRRASGGTCAAPVLAGAAGLVLGLCLGVAGWAAYANGAKQPGLTERELAVVLREVRLAQLEHRPAAPQGALVTRPQEGSR